MALMSAPFGATNSTKFYDENVTHRIYDAVGDVVKFQALTPEPCDDTTGIPTRFVVTQVGTNTVVNSATAGNWLTITTGGTEFNGVNVQGRGESFKLSAGMPLYFGVRMSISDATESDVLIGLAETNTVLLATSSAHGIGASNMEGAFFAKLDGGTTVRAYTYEGNVQTNNVAWGTALDTNMHTYEITWDGISQLSFYIDGVIVSTVTGTLPNGDLTPSINVRAGSGAARTCELSKPYCFQARS
jgi:hypothetical protein